MPNASTVLWTLAGLATLGAAACALFWTGKPKSVPDRITTHACAEILTRTRFSLSGWNQGRLGWTPYETFSLRLHGQPAPLSPNAVFLFPSALVLNTGDPNNTSQYHLLTCQAQSHPLTLLGDSRSGNVSASFLDAPTPPAPRSYLHQLSGGRLVLLGGSIVLDLDSRRHHPVPWPKDAAFHPNHLVPPLGASPDFQSFAVFAYAANPNNAPAIGVFNFISGDTYHLLLNRRLHRYNAIEDISREWFTHYFAWQDNRLIPRPAVQPLPYRGLRSFAHPGHREYRLVEVAPALHPIVRRFLIDHFHAQPIPGQDDTLLWQNRQLHVSARHEGYDRYVAVYLADGQDDSILLSIADRFDQLLAPGQYDSFFHPDIE